HAFTPAVTASDTVRVVSYNLLANLYADSDYSRNQLFPWCDPNYLSMSYRKCLIFRELSGYNNADLVALQEVDEPLFRSGGLAEFLEHECGLSGLSQMKLGQDGKPPKRAWRCSIVPGRFDLAEDGGSSSATVCRLTAAYEPQPFTNYTLGGFSGHLDHIFFDSRAAQTAGHGAPAKAEDIHPLTALAKIVAIQAIISPSSLDLIALLLLMLRCANEIDQRAAKVTV
uniref:Endo/exonuclease/phosphatase domain-containing protein n=1 Tax=Macrostomum lignano TaxID=282301 RepID=A0A1I8F7M3_9PLAT